MMNRALPALNAGVGRYAFSFPYPYISRDQVSTLPIVGGITATHPKTVIVIPKTVVVIVVVIMRGKRLSVLPMILVKPILVKPIRVKLKKTVPGKVINIQENILA